MSSATSRPRAQGHPCSSRGEVLEAAHLPISPTPDGHLASHVSVVSGRRSPMVSGFRPPSTGSWENRGSRLGRGSRRPCGVCSHADPRPSSALLGPGPGIQPPVEARRPLSVTLGWQGAWKHKGFKRTSTPTPRVSQEASRRAGAWRGVPCGLPAAVAAAAWNLPEAETSVSRNLTSDMEAKGSAL